MRSALLVSFFRRAVLMTLALPATACGGATSLGDASDAGPDATQLPSTPCSWSAGPRSACYWSLQFTGDPTTCAGFTGVGTAAQCVAICGRDPGGQPPLGCNASAGVDGGAGTVGCNGTGCTLNGGRRPGYFASLGFGPPPEGREVGSHFARVACMEAGSVEAFRWLRDELVAHGAPKRLVRAASRAIRDELRHVRVTSSLARRFGEEPIAPRPAPPRAVRPIEAVAHENAVEGCVRETYSALECLCQAHAARDPVVRAEMKRIARDELRHLALSWEVHAWAMTRLDRAARTRVAAAQRAAIRELLREVATDPRESLVATAGLPRGAQSRALVATIATRLAA